MDSYDQETLTFKYLIESEVLTNNTWKKFFPQLVQKGISSISTLLDTDEETLDGLQDIIPESPLNKLRKFRQDLITMKLKMNDTFSTPLGMNDCFTQYQFIPQWNVEQYLEHFLISDKSNEIIKAEQKVDNVMKDKKEFAGLTKQQAMLIALYCQEPQSDRSKSFYALVNKYLRERNENIVSFQSALYLLDSGIRRLPSLPATDTVTWRGVNYAPNLEKFYVGNTVCFTGICSTTSRKEVTLSFMEIGPPAGEHKRTLFKLNMINGKSISNWSRWENECEVITNLCSRWKVLKVNENHEEYFSSSILSYHCDYYIELQQIEGETLFPEPPVENRLSGLSLLLQVNYQPIDASKKFEEEFTDFFILLNDENAKNVLRKKLLGCWDEVGQRFHDDASTDTVKHTVINFLVGLTSLNEQFTKRDIETETAFRICEQKEIHSWIELKELEAKKRSETEFQDLGFSLSDSQKLVFETEDDRKLFELYNSLNSTGNFDNPHVESDCVSSKQLIHYVKREGSVISLYRVTQCILDGVQVAIKSDITSSILRFPGRYGFVLQRADVYVAAAMISVQISINAFQLWYGDITVRQFVKMTVTGILAIVAGAAGVIVGTMLCPVAGLAAIIAGLIAGAAAAGGGTAITQGVLEKLFPDGEEEDTNTKRKIYYQALASLKCLPSSTMPKIRKSYYELALENHPDKQKPENQEEATARFQSIVAAYENIVQYHEVLKNACKDLALDMETLTLDTIKEWQRVNQSMLRPVINKTDERTAKLRKSYKIVYRHLAYSNQVSFKWLRKLLNVDKTARFDEHRPSKQKRITRDKQS